MLIISDRVKVVCQTIPEVEQLKNDVAEYNEFRVKTGRD